MTELIEPTVYTYNDFARQYSVLDVTPTGVVLVTEAQEARLAEPKIQSSDLGELGTEMPSKWMWMDREDYNPELRGRQGLQKYDKMRRNDGQVRMSLRELKTPVLAGRWYIEPFDDSKKHRKIAAFIWKNLTEDMSCSWPQFILESLGMIDFGFYYFEQVWTINSDGKAIIKKFSPRHPMDFWEWDYDRHGGPQTAWFYAPKGTDQSVGIPISKLLCHVYDKEGGNMLGMSALRPSYKHHFFKDTLYRIDAIQKERHGIGIPIIKLPPNFNPQDKVIANELAANLRTNERSHVVLPPMWELEFIKLEGQPVDAMVSIEHHDKMIARNVMLDVEGENPDDQLFIKNASFVAWLFRDAINKWAIPNLVKWNWGITDYPKLKVRGIGNVIDIRSFSFAMRNMIGAGIIKPDDVLEEHVREVMDLPKADKETTRVVEAKQGAPFNQNANGKPRQSTANGMRVDSGSGRIGRDGGSPGA